MLLLSGLCYEAWPNHLSLTGSNEARAFLAKDIHEGICQVLESASMSEVVQYRQKLRSQSAAKCPSLQTFESK